MARIQFSALVTSITGALGGSVMQRTRYGAIVKNGAYPVGQLRRRQQRHQTKLGHYVDAWNSLTDTQRNAWQAWADNYGQRIHAASEIRRSGRAVFLFRHLHTSPDVSTIITVPTARPGRLSNLLPTDVISDTGTLTAEASVVEDIGSWAHQFYITRPIRPSAFYKASENRFMFDQAVPSGEQDITTRYTNLFGRVPEPGEYVGCRDVFIQFSSGSVIIQGPYITEVG